MNDKFVKEEDEENKLTQPLANKSRIFIIF